MTSTITIDLAGELGCSEMAAGEVLKHAAALAIDFAAIYGAFDVDYVITLATAIRRDIVHQDIPSNRYTAELQNKLNEWKKHVSKVRRSLPGSVRKLLTLYEAACLNDALFGKAYHLACPSNQIRHSEALTKALTVLYEHQKLRNADKIGEGRIACQAIGRAGASEIDLPQGRF